MSGVTADTTTEAVTTCLLIPVRCSGEHFVVRAALDATVQNVVDSFFTHTKVFIEWHMGSALTTSLCYDGELIVVPNSTPLILAHRSSAFEYLSIEGAYAPVQAEQDPNAAYYDDERANREADSPGTFRCSCCREDRSNAYKGLEEDVCDRCIVVG